MQYLDELSSIIQTEGMRDNFVTEKRLKQLNKENPSNIIIYHSENSKGRCIVYYGLIDEPSYIGTYEFKLGKIPRSKSIASMLSLDVWESDFNSTIWENNPSLETVKGNIISWVQQYKDTHKKEFNQFVSSLMVVHKYTGQLIVAYKEFNGEIKRVKPICRLHESVTIKQLITYGKQKSKELWNREFTCKVEEVKTYWKQQLGVYCPDDVVIKFSAYKNSSLSIDDIFDTMIHEMVHWHLHTSGKPYSDEDFEFIEECLKVGCSLSKDSKAQKAYQDYLKLVCKI